MSQLTQETITGSAARGSGYRAWRRVTPYFGVLPFLTLATLFLLWPTISVMTGAFQDAKGHFTFQSVHDVWTSSTHLAIFKNTLLLSGETALIGALLGGLLSYAVATGKPDGILRRIWVSATGVLAQFGGVMLAFGFVATFGFNGFITTFVKSFAPHSFFANPSWLYGITGLAFVYCFFQIPLMFIVFLPAIDNLRANWREASDSLGGSTWEYWRRVGIPVLTPSFLGSALLLFANAFSAYATAASLVSQGSIITPLEISGSLSSETGLANAATAKALSFGMVAVVVVVMALYTLLRRKVSKWEKS